MVVSEGLSGEYLHTQHSGHSGKQFDERVDSEFRSEKNDVKRAPTQAGPENSGKSDSIFCWCEGWEIDAIQDGVCGNSAIHVESRDDVANVEHQKDKENPLENKNSLIDRTVDSIIGSPSRDYDLTKTRSEFEAKNDPSLSRSSQKRDGKESSSLQQVKRIFNSSTVSPGKKTRHERFMNLIEAATIAYGTQSLPVADLYISMGIELYEGTEELKSTNLALILYEEAFRIYQTKLGDSDVRTVDCRIRIGRSLHSLGRHDEALDYFCQAVYMREALLGELHSSVSDIWVFISSVHRSKAKLELALKASAKALTGYRNAHGDKHKTVIAVLKNISLIHTEMGNDDKAAEINKYVRLHSPDSNTFVSPTRIEL